jgi:hypothetical protein
MRDIEFRALDNNGNFIYGLPYYGYGLGGFFISHSDGWEPSFANPDGGASTELTECNPETLGQFTGLKDKNGVKIFEGDIVSYGSVKRIGVIEHSVTGGMVGHVINFNSHTKGLYWEASELYIQREMFEVIGNKWQNPELLEQAK